MTYQVFISYSHADRRWRDRLVIALKPFARADEISYFDDTQLRPGEDWRAALDREIGRANVAVLLVSANFLASDFVADVELPHILARAKAGEMTVAWLPVSTSAYETTDLKDIQALISPKRPLDRMSKPDADAALVKAARLIAGSSTVTGLGHAMHVIDEVYSELKPEAGLGAGPVRIQARHTGVAVAFEERGVATPIETITAADLEKLPPEEHRLIQSLRDGMNNEYERWTALRPRRRTLTASERQEYESSGREMCAELRNILDFIEQTLGKDLQDHYRGIRFACDKLVATSS